MKRTVMIIIFSALAVLILLVAVLVLKFAVPQKVTEVTESVISVEDESNLTLFLKEVDNLTKLQIKNKLDEYTIEKISASDKFTIKGIDEASLLDNAFAATLASAGTLKASQIVEENATNLEQYGFLNPQGEITVTSKDGETCTIMIGNEAPIGEGTYVKNGSTVYLFNTSSISEFLKSRYAFVNTVLMPIYDQEKVPNVSKVTIERGDLPKPIVIEATPETSPGVISLAESHKMVSPFEIEVDMENEAAVVYGMYGLMASEAVAVGVQDADMERYGITKPSCTVTMEADGKSYILTLGKTAKEVDENGKETAETKGYYGMFSETPGVIYLLSTNVLPWIDATPESLMAKLVCTPYIFSLENFIYEDETQKLVFAIEGTPEEHTFKLNDELITDEEQMKSLYQFFVSVTADELYTDTEKGKFIGRITYTDSKTKATNIIEFYDSKDRKTIINVNGTNLFKGRAMLGVRLQENVQNYLTGKEIILNY